MTIRRINLAAAALFCLIWALAASAEYKADLAGPPPADLSAGIRAEMQKAGIRISNNGAPYCELWFRSNEPPSTGTTEAGVTLPFKPGALLGVIRFNANGVDRRGQEIKPGVYTLRYVHLPSNRDHEGAGRYRDFVLLAPAALDQDLNATPNFEALVALSRKASGTAHPAVLSLWKADRDAPGFGPQDNGDWVLETKIGDTPIAVILIGTL